MSCIPSKWEVRTKLIFLKMISEIKLLVYVSYIFNIVYIFKLYLKI